VRLCCSRNSEGPLQLPHYGRTCIDFQFRQVESFWCDHAYGNFPNIIQENSCLWILPRCRSNGANEMTLQSIWGVYAPVGQCFHGPQPRKWLPQYNWILSWLCRLEDLRASICEKLSSLSEVCVDWTLENWFLLHSSVFFVNYLLSETSKYCSLNWFLPLPITTHSTSGWCFEAGAEVPSLCQWTLEVQSSCSIVTLASIGCKAQTTLSPVRA